MCRWMETKFVIIVRMTQDETLQMLFEWHNLIHRKTSENINKQ